LSVSLPSVALLLLSLVVLLESLLISVVLLLLPEVEPPGELEPPNPLFELVFTLLFFISVAELLVFLLASMDVSVVVEYDPVVLVFDSVVPPRL
jgi:hypothetical protein